ncbi:RNA-binding S4 domain-containing protein [Colwellia sp. RE-S-Sl-9]
MSDDYPTVSISYQPIELCKLLKIANMVSGGGEAKIVIGEGYVYLNGEVEFQKRKKIYNNDIIEFNGDLVQVVCSKPASTSEEVKKAKVQKAKVKTAQSKSSNKNTQQHAIAQETPIPSTPAKRRPISF